MNPIKLFLVLSAIFRVSTLCSYCMCEKCYAGVSYNRITRTPEPQFFFQRWTIFER